MATLTPLMSLSLPTIGVDSGLVWEQQINSNMNILDGHNHSIGSGNPITPSGVNINSDLPFNGNNAISLLSARFIPQLSVLTGASDLSSLYVVGTDLYYNNTSGIPVQITSGSTVHATSSGISNGTNSASFPGSPANTLVVNANATTPANIQGASIIIGNTGVSGTYFGITLSPPNTGALTASYPLYLPSTPASTSYLTLDSTGVIAAATPVSSLSAQLVPTGGVIAFAGNTAPVGFLICNGSSALVSVYPALFSVIGYSYGGSGANFNLPNLVNSAPFGIGNRFTIGQTGGYVDPSLNTLASHTHAATVTDPGHTHLLTVYQVSDGSPFVAQALDSSSGVANELTSRSFTGISVTNSSVGNSTTYGNMPPFLGMNYIIKT